MKMPSPAASSGHETVARVDKADVGRRARAGAVWSVLQIGGRNIISIGTTAFLARILSPDDYGLIGMVATLTALLLVFSDMGLSWATVQRAQLNRIQVSNLFWVNIAAGALLWGICVALAPPVADFYQRPELVAVTSIMGASFLLAGFAVQPFALMQRQMRFQEIAKIEILALLVGTAAGIASAVAGHGYWALVVQTLTMQAARTLMALPRSGLAIMRPRHGANTRSLLAFGGILAINGILIYLARNLDSVLIGRWWGSEALGYYNRAYFLMLLPSMLATGVLTNLMVPSLAAFQDDRERFGAAYRRAVTLVAFVGSPMAAGLALTAEESVRLVYGEQWLPVAPMVMWLSIAGITQPIYNTTGWLFTAVGKGKAYLLLTVINAVVLASAFFAAIPYGPLAVATAYGIVMGLLLLGPALWWAHRCAAIKLRDTALQLLPVCLCVAAMIAAAITSAKLATLGGLGWQAIFGIKVATGIVAYLVCAAWIMPAHIRSEILAGFRREKLAPN
jgi:PST family polysaccharide transporter